MNYVVWDFDGTLAERPGMWSAALAEAAELEGLAVEVEELRPYLQEGFPWHAPDEIRTLGEGEWWESLELLFEGVFVSRFDLERAFASRISKRVRSAYLDASRWRVFEEVRDVLGNLSEGGWRHVILSNHVPELDDLVACLGLGSYFEVIFSSGRTGVEKPNAAAFAMVRDYVGSNSRVVMVGDSWRADICGAKSAGWESVLVRREHPEAVLWCADLKGLPALLALGS